MCTKNRRDDFGKVPWTKCFSTEMLFLQIVFAEERAFGLCWEKSKYKEPSNPGTTSSSATRRKTSIFPTSLTTMRRSPLHTANFGGILNDPERYDLGSYGRQTIGT